MKINWKIAGIAVGFLIAAAGLTNAFYYNEAGYQTHIRTIFGEEKVATEVGFTFKGWGRATPWKQAQTVQFTETQSEDTVDDAVSVPGYRVVFLGNVDGAVAASTRFRLPQGEQFLKIVREYRTPDNFYQTAVVPAVKETLQTTASMMSADDYYAGARSEFSSSFEDQLNNGQFQLRRIEKVEVNQKRQQDDPNAIAGKGEAPLEETKRTQFEVSKLVDSKGNYLRKAQNFRTLGVEVVEARITNIEPNKLFKDRMVKVQVAQADLAVARQNRLKEEENKLLVIAQGERQVEEKRQETLKNQIEQTTNAQTSKQLTIIEAEKMLEKARIEKETNKESLAASNLMAQQIRTLADAKAHEKRSLAQANDSLEAKLEAYVKTQEAWAEAYKTAAVPQVVMGNNGSNDHGRMDASQSLMNMLGVKAARDLLIDPAVKK